MKLNIHKSFYFLVVVAAISQALGGCDDSSGGGNPSAAPPVTPPPSSGPPVVSIPATHGYFAGGIEGVYAEALLTVDGLIRIFVDGIPGASDTPGSRQFVGHLEFADGEAHGNGMIYTQGCDRRSESTVACGGVLPADITITAATRNELLGELMLAGGDVWSFSMAWPTATYLEPATFEFASGQYSDSKADAAISAVISVDGTGRIFFQSPESGCVGNGSLAPHGDGMFNVYDVTMVIDSCAIGHEANNGHFEGFATRTIGDDFWGDWLVVWASTVDSALVPQAFVMWGWKN